MIVISLFLSLSICSSVRIAPSLILPSQICMIHTTKRKYKNAFGTPSLSTRKCSHLFYFFFGLVGVVISLKPRLLLVIGNPLLLFYFSCECYQHVQLCLDVFLPKQYHVHWSDHWQNERLREWERAWEREWNMLNRRKTRMQWDGRFPHPCLFTLFSPPLSSSLSCLAQTALNGLSGYLFPSKHISTNMHLRSADKLHQVRANETLFIVGWTNKIKSGKRP